MKNHIFGFISLALSLPVWANDEVSIDFEVSAEAAACTPTLSNNGVVDYGTNHVSSLSTHAFTQIGARDITLSIQCESSTSVAITARDSRASSMISGKDDRNEEGARFQINGGGYVSDKTRLFGLGYTAENRPIGSYAIQIVADKVTAVDGEQSVSVDIGGAAGKDGPWAHSTLLPLPANEDYFFTFLKKGTSEPQPIMNAQVPLQVSTTIANKLNSSQAINLDGSAVISIVYL